jgi:outer membrane lipoprotein-sorting protein
VVAVGAVIAGTSVAGAQTAPSLPARSAAQLLADAQSATGPGPMTATVQETANLGLPDLPGIDDSSSALSLLTGSHTVTIWYADPTHVRVADPVQLGETDLRRDGRQVWLWDSTTQTATHLVLPAQPSGQSRSGQSRSAGSPAGQAAGSPLTPQQVARQVLAAVGPTTTVSVQRNVTVAGQAAYQLAVAPKDSRSLIGQVRIAIDASRHLPLRVQVFARGATSPAFEVGFTALSFGRPAASNFAFTPPAGAKVKTVKVPAPALPPAGQRRPADSRHALAGRPVPHGSLYAKPGSGWSGSAPPAGGTYLSGGAFAGVGQPTVLGQGWLSVLVLPAGSSAGATTTTTAFPAGSPAYSSSSTSSPASGAKAAPGSAGPDSAILRALLHSATPVHGAWGSGRLLRTSLVSVLLTSKGTVLVGAVAPSVLYTDAAAAK